MRKCDAINSTRIADAASASIGSCKLDDGKEIGLRLTGYAIAGDMLSVCMYRGDVELFSIYGFVELKFTFLSILNATRCE